MIKMVTEPAIKRAIAFVDGQNLYHSARASYGYNYPNYDILALSTAICLKQNWNLCAVHFYTGVPDANDNADWSQFWTSKLAQMGRQGVRIFTRKLRYRNQTVKLPDGNTHTFLVGQEKGIDVRIALDIVNLAHRKSYDVALVFSQDQDLSEVADEIRAISKEQIRWVKMACAFPFSPVTSNRRGINGTDWIKIDRKIYDACLDPKDHRAKKI